MHFLNKKTNIKLTSVCLFAPDDLHVILSSLGLVFCSVKDFRLNKWKLLVFLFTNNNVYRFLVQTHILKLK